MGKGKNRAFKIKEYPPPRREFYLVVANPFGLTPAEGVDHQDFHNRLGIWLETISGLRTTGIFHHRTMSSVVVSFNGQLDEDMNTRLLGEFVMVNRKDKREHVSQIFEYDFVRYGSPSEIQRCACGMYAHAAKAAQTLARDAPPAAEYTLNFEKRYAKVDRSRFRAPIQQDVDVKDDVPPQQLSQPPIPPDPASRWAPYETPLSNIGRVQQQEPEYDIVSSRAVNKRVDPVPKAEPIDAPMKLEQDVDNKDQIHKLPEGAPVKREKTEPTEHKFKVEDDVDTKDHVQKQPEDPRVANRRDVMAKLEAMKTQSTRPAEHEDDVDSKDRVQKPPEDPRVANRRAVMAKLEAMKAQSSAQGKTIVKSEPMEDHMLTQNTLRSTAKSTEPSKSKTQPIKPEPIDHALPPVRTRAEEYTIANSGPSTSNGYHGKVPSEGSSRDPRLRRPDKYDGDRIKHEPIDRSIRPSDPRRSGAAVKHEEGVDGLVNSGPDGTRSRSGYSDKHHSPKRGQEFNNNEGNSKRRRVW